MVVLLKNLLWMDVINQSCFILSSWEYNNIVINTTFIYWCCDISIFNHMYVCCIITIKKKRNSLLTLFYHQDFLFFYLLMNSTGHICAKLQLWFYLTFLISLSHTLIKYPMLFLFFFFFFFGFVGLLAFEISFFYFYLVLVKSFFFLSWHIIRVFLSGSNFFPSDSCKIDWWMHDKM